MIGVVLSTPHKFHLASWLIKHGTQFPASHAAICVLGKGWFADELLVLESTSKGTVFVNSEVWDKDNKAVRALRLTAHEDVAAGALRPIIKKLGTGYDYRGAYGYGLRLVLYAYTGMLLPAPDTPDKMFCSELVARWMNDFRGCLGKDPLPLSPDATSPAALYRELRPSPWFEEVPCESSLSATFT